MSPLRSSTVSAHGGRLLALLIPVAAALGLAPGCLERRDEGEDTSELTRCASCHGDPGRDGSYLIRAAPPSDLWPSTDVSYPGVGAHSIHLSASETHEALACSECHIVPDTVDAPGHADDGRPAELVFGDLAKTGGREPSYDPEARLCADTWCHREADAVWTRPKDSEHACGTCHGLPPPSPHPQSGNCSACHAEVVDASGHIINRALHVNGRVEYEAGACQLCHGDADTAAPPLDTSGNRATSEIGVGAHRAHLAGGSSSRALSCAECHVVPETVDAPTHADGLPAELVFSGVAASFGREPLWDHAARTCGDTWCHSPVVSGGSSPEWTSDAPLDCGDCHGAPPPLPHPQTLRCEQCHAEVVDENMKIVDRALHVDGQVELDVTSDCRGCHGDLNAAPPLDTLGNASTDFPGVGAHQTHVLGTGHSRAVPCQECHLVPDDVLESGHLDSAAPAELTFSGAAVAFGAMPRYAHGSCQASYCHGADFPGDHLSGGTQTEPEWTRVDGSQNACGSCHGLPPPLPHLQIDTCSDCHQNVRADNRSFKDPDLHVNGVVDNALPSSP